MSAPAAAWSSSPTDSPRSASSAASPVNSTSQLCSFCSGADDVELMCRCLDCSSVYHIYCTVPPQSRVSRSWRCSQCKDNPKSKVVPVESHPVISVPKKRKTPQSIPAQNQQHPKRRPGRPRKHRVSNDESESAKTSLKKPRATKKENWKEEMATQSERNKQEEHVSGSPSASSGENDGRKYTRGKPFVCLRSLPFKGKDNSRILDLNAPPGSPRRQTGPKSSSTSATSELPPLSLSVSSSSCSHVEKNTSSQEASSESSSSSSRKLRAEQRRFQTGLNSQDWTPGNLLQFNPFVCRQKKLHLGKSGIHSLGVYAMETIKANDFVIEYIGQLIRPSVAEIREKLYDKMDVGGSYLFRIDSEVVIDATFKGNLARFINHSCEPNCFTKVISVGQTKHVVIYAKRDIQVGEELAYDYKFPLEDDHMKVPCTCGKPKCRKTLN
eukprot:TRINITY_DN4628_c0_g1_i5.p1 TRINITY_DN4628_c0_g1~~TRINITY_DN4628_c0_g1_i5.p1  ORF type:complete len:440 (+),score=93.67 TRINITY_DN4628_c0_g1_i5:40-1359(+)